jgi:CubicO group peptidase (beta-lactamase class C family)
MLLSAYSTPIRSGPQTRARKNGATGTWRSLFPRAQRARAAYYSQGRLVYEKCQNGWEQDELHRLASGTKGFSGVLAAAAVQDGLLDWDERVADTITDGESDPQKLWITENR